MSPLTSLTHSTGVAGKRSPLAAKTPKAEAMSRGETSWEPSAYSRLWRSGLATQAEEIPSFLAMAPTSGTPTSWMTWA